ncbi:hypothetical protein N7471_012698 [Penicillium samsonianum]|uniref:uncharacterized protein n=1 Tax=Penicillium samsonianum TaxID=1882272 RepID=UPI002549B027|nr:uncharacterized protein N7471_012698 [Penicillium samsonianum]KAJ6125381.1 hypothetical protein N7471_012698 [Penicillium samsonianum]
MASNRVTKAKPTKKAAAKPIIKPTVKATAKAASESSREVLEERIEFLLTCIKVDLNAVGQHYGISTNAANMRLRRAKDYVAKLVRAREEAQNGDEAPDTTEDEEA